MKDELFLMLIVQKSHNRPYQPTFSNRLVQRNWNLRHPTDFVGDIFRAETIYTVY